jgi:hypothetical protein
MTAFSAEAVQALRPALANPRNARPIGLAPLKGGAPRREIRPPKYRPATRPWHTKASYLSNAGSIGTR